MVVFLGLGGNRADHVPPYEEGATIVVRDGSEPFGEKAYTLWKVAEIVHAKAGAIRCTVGVGLKNLAGPEGNDGVHVGWVDGEGTAVGRLWEVGSCLVAEPIVVGVWGGVAFLLDDGGDIGRGW